MYRLLAKLPADRRLAGEYRLYNAAGNVAHVGDCLGKADNIRAAKEANPSRDPIQPYGDTPFGHYAPAKVERFEPPHQRMGTFAIPLSGASGDALQARVAGRTGLYVHAGRGDDRLVPTFGCLRLRDRDMDALARIIGDAVVEIVICAEGDDESGA